MYLDSTARLNQFAYRRTDQPQVTPFPPEEKSLFLGVTSPAYRRELKIDSTGKLVTVTETVNGLDVKIPLTITIEDYIRLRFAEDRRRNWRSFIEVNRNILQSDQLGSVLKSFTNISIPVPSNPLFSIFGGKDIKLNVSGAVDIRAGFRRTSSDKVTSSALDQVRNEPNFNQDVRVNVNGTIGDKLNILADWNTQRTFDFENQLKIKYTGYDDEIIKTIEAGNVSLRTPALIGGGQSLFGVKANMQMGPLNLTTLVSQKKGQTRELSISGGSESRDMTIYPSNYSHSHYFVDLLYAQFWENLHSSEVTSIPAAVLDNEIVDIDVWRSVSNYSASTQQFSREVYAHTDIGERGAGYPPNIDETLGSDASKSYSGYFIRLDPQKDYDVDTRAGVIRLESVQDEDAIAVSYRTVSQKRYGGDTTSSGKLILKLIKPKLLWGQPSYKPGWDLMLKNIYSLGGRELKKEGFTMNLFRGSPGQAEVDEIRGVPLLRVMGLDRFDQNNQPNPDQNFDFIPGITIDVEHAELIFPSLKPFQDGIVNYFTRRGIDTTGIDSLIFPDVYDTTQAGADKNTIKNKYFMRGVINLGQRSKISLGFNVVEGSVQVLLNGSPMTPNVDYTVDYIIGEVVLRSEQATLPGANVEIKYEQNDLFQIASKTLIGARGEMDLIPNTRLGFTAMNLNQATLSDKVRVGEEPTNNSILGMDASSAFDLPVLTSLLNGLPGIRTNEMSSMKFSGEAAYMIPDPNTKKSPILSDNAASIAMIDDFEGARRSIPFPIIYGAWTYASAPVVMHSGLDGTSDTVRGWSRARLDYFNILPSDVVIENIWPRRQYRTGENRVTVLNLNYYPRRRAMYNYSPNLDSTLHRSDTDSVRQNWNGITRYLGSSAGSVLDQNMSFLEIWMKVDSKNAEDLLKGRLHVSLGRVSEDVIPNRKLNSEDLIPGPSNPTGFPNGILNPSEEDFGLDTIPDARERVVYSQFLQNNAGDPDVSTTDPSGDNWSYTSGSLDFTRIDGLEGNGNSVDGRLPDTEDLSGNGIAELDNEYAEYEIPVDTVYTDREGNLVTENRYITGGGTDRWFQYRVPLLDPDTIIGSAVSVQSVLQNVQYVRLWLSGFSDSVKIRIAEMGMVGNQWQERIKNDSVMKISVVNIEDNPEYESSPGYRDLGIVREKDRTQPDKVIEGNEQSLALVFENLEPGDSRFAVRYFGKARPLDLFNYKSLRMFVYGDPALIDIGTGESKADVIVRFGTDTLNFYEYRAPIREFWDSGNWVSINFEQLTAVKAGRDSAGKLTYVDLPSPPGARYGVRGNPSLRQVVEISVGVENLVVNGQVGLPISGRIWLNELRLVDVDNTPGLAYRYDAQVKLADFGNFSFNFAQSDPSFHALADRFGNQMTNISWALNANFSLEDFLPQSWKGSSIPVAYSHREQLVKPKYLPNTDIVVEEAALLAASLHQDTSQVVRETPDQIIRRSQTLRVSDSYSVQNLRLGLPSDAWYVTETINKLSFGFNYSTARDRDPALETRTVWNWNASVNYGVNIPQKYYIQPFDGFLGDLPLLGAFRDWKVFYVPISNFTAGIAATRGRTYELTRASKGVPRDARTLSSAKKLGFAWKLTDKGLLNLNGNYNLAIDRSLNDFDNDSVGRDFGSILQTVLFRGTDRRYAQSVRVNSKPGIPHIFSLDKFLDVTLSYDASYNWSNAFQQGDIGKSAGVSNRFGFQSNFKLKQFTDPWFAEAVEKKPAAAKPAPPKAPKPGADSSGVDSTALVPPPPPDDDQGGMKLFDGLKNVSRLLIKIPLLDYDNVNVNVTQANRSSNPGVVGSTGFRNFWGRLPFQGSVIENGPSRLYQLGVLYDPSGELHLGSKSSFPFIRFGTTRGRRAPNAVITNSFSQVNNINMKTDRPLWQGARISFEWKIGWQYSKTTRDTTDSFGNPSTISTTTTGSIERSYMTFPSFLFLKFLNTNLENVGKKYDEYQASMPADLALSKAFEDGLEAAPWLHKVFGQFLPRVNWSLRWDGLEKVAGISSVVQRMSLEHNYSSTFRRDFREVVGVGEQTDNEKIVYGFNPLIGINTVFKQFLKGSLTGNVKFNTTTSYDLHLSSSNRNITEDLTQDIQVTLSYARSGFSFPLFGVNLSNDINVSFSYTLSKKSQRLHDPRLLSTTQEGSPLGGSTRTQMEPRVRYVLSSRVTASLYYRLSQISPDAEGSSIVGTTTNEAGIDIHISI
ncbi:MAG TPA: cell surface protein SprA [Bacteroidota bacterium]|nr:cell surface protein SprA [Bacteroidota bacterium]